MTFERIKPQKGSEIVMTHMKEQIQAGSYLPGSKLPTVDQLAVSFEVGRSTIREAMSALKAMGWVDIRHGGGTFVSKTLPSGDGLDNGGDLFYQTESFQEVLEVRKFIEAGCASLAAERRTEDDLQLLAQAIQEMEAAIDNESLSEQADIRFHLSVAKASHNSLFLNMMESLTDRLQESMKESRRLWFFAERASVKLLIQEHKDIYEAIKDQDAKLAEERVMQHILKVDRVVQKLGAKA
ncbi:GntR family transcriptional regulator [Paenibacillus ferrarius]|uniref:GntR family transcriptional regulator n=1 Tax=Paenibacillus ferrarius TaxID=1469647 RepID=A0A1V4HE08_9BACL|nr:FadR/GntR family transcriptional regulator [Paenibacillus ferrarius]OPH52111.1 GntR family transcriptional regulator [Paenibacillus ferrarius]